MNVKIQMTIGPLTLTLSRQGRENYWMRLPRASPSQRLRRIAAPPSAPRNDKKGGARSITPLTPLILRGELAASHYIDATVKNSARNIVYDSLIS